MFTLALDLTASGGHSPQGLLGQFESFLTDGLVPAPDSQRRANRLETETAGQRKPGVRGAIEPHIIPVDSGAMHLHKLQALVYHVLPSTTAV